MLARLRMKLGVEGTDFGYYQSSNMQGILMEQLENAYVEKLHVSGLKPYSQYVIGGNQNEWIINSLTREAYEKMILPLLDQRFTEFNIEKRNIHINIQEKELKIIAKKELLDEFYSDEYSRYINMDFLTPVAFKSNGRYMILPDIRLIYQSLMNKYSATSDDMDMYDEETLEQLVSCSEIAQYKLKSAFFPLEGVRIPAFKGELCIKVKGTSTMAKYVRLLARYGEYSGVGIKTAIGMGALQMKKWGKKDD